MGFESLNYSTTEKIDDTIQDQIDRLKQETKKDLNELKWEILTGVKTLTVDTISSRLNIRNQAGEIIGKAQDKEKLTFQNKIMDRNGKLFLFIQSSSGKSGYVSADYVRASHIDNKMEQSVVKPAIEKEEVNIEKTENIQPMDSKISSDQARTEIDEKKETQNINTEAEEIKEEKQKPVEKIEEVNSEIIMVTFEDIQKSYHTFLNEVERLDSFGDLKSDKEKQDAQKLISNLYAVLVYKISLVEKNTKTPPTDKQVIKINQIKLDLARYFSDEHNSVENQHWKDYREANNIALSILGEINGKTPPPPITQEDILQTIKGTGVAEYMITELKNGESVASIYQNEVVKDRMNSTKETLIEDYETQLEEFLEYADNHKNTLSIEQQQALELLLDVNGVGFFDIKESNWDMMTLAWVDFAAIWAGAAAGLFTWAKVWGASWVLAWWIGAIPWSIIGWIAWAVTWWAVATGWMMLNHGDNYFKDGTKWLTELWLNTAMFGVWGAVFKGARIIQGSHSLLSARGAAAIWLEAAWDVGIWMGMDITRGAAYDYEVDTLEAFQNNLIWALLPLAIQGWTAFSSARKNFANKTHERIQAAQVAESLGDSQASKEIMEDIAEEAVQLRKAEEPVIHNKTTAHPIAAEVPISKTDVNINTSTGVISIKWERLQIVPNQSFYIHAKNGKTYRLETWENGSITNVFNISNNDIHLTWQWKEVKLGWNAKWWVIKENIAEIRKNFSVDGTYNQRTRSRTKQQTSRHTNETTSNQSSTQTENVNQSIKENTSEHNSTLTWDQRSPDFIWPRNKPEIMNNQVWESLSASISSHLRTLRKVWDSQKIWSFEIKLIEKSPLPLPSGTKKYEITSPDGKFIKTWSNEVASFITNSTKKLEDRLNLIQKVEAKKYSDARLKLEKEATKLEEWYSFHKDGRFLDGSWKVTEFKDLPTKVQTQAIEKVLWFKGLDKIIDNSLVNLENILSKSGKEKLATSWGKDAYASLIGSKIWEKINKNYESGIIKGSFKTGWTALNYWVWQPVKHSWNVSMNASIIHPIKASKATFQWGIKQWTQELVSWNSKWIDWKKRTVWAVWGWTILEYINSGENDQNLSAWETITNILYRSAHLGTFWIWTFLSEPVSDTIYWQLKGFEERDFIPAAVDNILSNDVVWIINLIPWVHYTPWEIPYQIPEAIHKTDEEIQAKIERNKLRSQ